MILFKSSKLKRYYKKAKAMSEQRQNNQVNDNVLRKEIELYFAMAKIYDVLKYNKKFPHAALYAIENYRAAANLGDVQAQFTVGERLLDFGKFFGGLNDSLYQSTTHEKYESMFFEEAYAFFDMAGKRGFTKANRMRGVMLINGWGIEKDTDQGLKLIVDSIEKEGAWDRSTEIFGELGLNQPEFFSAIMAKRGASS